MSLSKSSLSKEELSIRAIEAFYLSTEKALRSFYHETNTFFTGLSIDELQTELDKRMDELDKSVAMTILAAIEAHLKVNYILRSQNKYKDELSKKFRKLYIRKGFKASLDEDILELWKDYVNKESVVSEIRSAFKFRHWLAHGRFWVAKLGRKYDFKSLHRLAIFAQEELNIDMGAQ
jgi:hypothetical protein